MDPPGRRIVGNFELLEPLGAGGMGEVFKAPDRRLNRFVALKFLPRGASREARERFHQEALTIASLNHPHICTLHEVGDDGERPYLVLELLEGETLKARLRRGALKPGQLLDCAVQITDALDAAHRKGVLHRDLKPDNIWVSPDALLTARADGSQVHQLQIPPAGDGYLSRCRGGSPYPTHAPAWSPDGRWIQVDRIGRNQGRPVGRVELVSAADGRRLDLGPNPIYDATDASWLPGGAGLVFTAAIPWPGVMQVWEIAYPSGRATQLSNDLQGYQGASLSSHGELALIHSAPQYSIWSQAKAGGEFRELPGGGATQDGRLGFNWTPEGGFVSLRTFGTTSELWAEDGEGGSARVLPISPAPGREEVPEVAPNGQIVFFARTPAALVNVTLASTSAAQIQWTSLAFSHEAQQFWIWKQPGCAGAWTGLASIAVVYLQTTPYSYTHSSLVSGSIACYGVTAAEWSGSESDFLSTEIGVTNASGSFSLTSRRFGGAVNFDTTTPGQVTGFTAAFKILCASGCAAVGQPSDIRTISASAQVSTTLTNAIPQPQLPPSMPTIPTKPPVATYSIPSKHSIAKENWAVALHMAPPPGPRLAAAHKGGSPCLT